MLRFPRKLLLATSINLRSVHRMLFPCTSWRGHKSYDSTRMNERECLRKTVFTCSKRQSLICTEQGSIYKSSTHFICLISIGVRGLCGKQVRTTVSLPWSNQWLLVNIQPLNLSLFECYRILRIHHAQLLHEEVIYWPPFHIIHHWWNYDAMVHSFHHRTIQLKKKDYLLFHFNRWPGSAPFATCC